MVKWLDDNLCKECHNCNTKFTLFTRKHHCRLCGLIFCHKCLKNKEVTVNYQTKVCLLCIQQEKKTYINYLFDELAKRDYIISQLKFELKKCKKKNLDNFKSNSDSSKNLKLKSSSDSSENIICENKFNIAEYLKKLK